MAQSGVWIKAHIDYRYAATAAKMVESVDKELLNVSHCPVTPDNSLANNSLRMVISDAGKAGTLLSLAPPYPWGWGVKSWRRLSYYGEPLSSVNWASGAGKKGRKNLSFRVGQAFLPVALSEGENKVCHPGLRFNIKGQTESLSYFGGS